MLDGSRYFAEFPDEYPNKVLLSVAALNVLKAIEREISQLIESETASAERCESEER